MSDVSNVRPVSMDSIENTEIDNPISLSQKNVKGRPQTKRMASSCDNFTTGKKRKSNAKKSNCNYSNDEELVVL